MKMKCQHQQDVDLFDCNCFNETLVLFTELVGSMNPTQTDREQQMTTYKNDDFEGKD
jgi:hypothetical protein